MTVIAWDGKIVAADKQATSNGTISTANKLFQHPKDPNIYLATCGALATGLILVDWYIDGADTSEWPKDSQDEENWSFLIVFGPDGIFEYSQWSRPIPIIDPFQAWGSGRDIATGAMAMGADAIRAVEIASQYDTECGRGVDWFDTTKMGAETTNIRPTRWNIKKNISRLKEGIRTGAWHYRTDGDVESRKGRVGLGKLFGLY